MAATGDTPGSPAPLHGLHAPLEEAAWVYQLDQVRVEHLPMTAAEALAAGVDSPALRELAGLSRHADPRDIRDAFEQAVEELEIALPDLPLARRHALRRLATRFVAGEVALAELGSDEWSELEGETEEERAFLALLSSCACCVEYTLGFGDAEWEAQLRVAAHALASRSTVGPLGVCGRRVPDTPNGPSPTGP
ncbi:hypothetical protein [Streptomyces sp. NPDC046909]|uniref:hypothetical protein n=1 Tax=Streptomyces sp. NPDC046909 TaxID=3155617 RepID=UPI00340D28A9